MLHLLKGEKFVSPQKVFNSSETKSGSSPQKKIIIWYSDIFLWFEVFHTPWLIKSGCSFTRRNLLLWAAYAAETAH